MISIWLNYFPHQPASNGIVKFVSHATSDKAAIHDKISKYFLGIRQFFYRYYVPIYSNVSYIIVILPFYVNNNQNRIALLQPCANKGQSAKINFKRKAVRKFDNVIYTILFNNKLVANNFNNKIIIKII